MIYELSNLLQQFNAKMFEQEHVSLLLVETAAESVSNVEAGNKELA